METTTRLEKIIGNIRLKELEVIYKLSNNVNQDSKILQTLISPNKHNFIAVNGDWEEVLGYTEKDCRGKSWNMIMPDYEIKRTSDFIDMIKDAKSDFSEYLCDVITQKGKIIKTSWKTKYYPEINMVISIGVLI